MAKDCYTKEFMGVVDNDNLDYFGYIKATVDTTGMQSNYTPYFINVGTGGVVQKVAGVRLLDGKTFANGKTETEAGDKVEFIAGDTYKVLFPKYAFPIVATSFDANDSNGHISYNLDDYDFVSFTNKQASDSWMGLLSYIPTVGGKKVSGSLENFVDWMNPAVVGGIKLTGSDISVDLGNTKLSNFHKLSSFYLDKTTNVTGNIIDFINSLSINNASALKQRTNTLTIRVYLTSANLGVFNVSQVFLIKMQFTGASAITITANNSQGTVLKTWNYDIDTQTLSEA